MDKRALTPAYIFFYILFWPDTWRIVIGIALSVFLTPSIIPSDQGLWGIVMLYVMMACMGYAVANAPARGISRWLRKIILKTQ